jgi:signal transduction histidine kinase
LNAARLALAPLLAAHPSIQRVIVLQGNQFKTSVDPTYLLTQSSPIAGILPPDFDLQMVSVDFPGLPSPDGTSPEEIESAFGTIFRALYSEKQAGRGLEVVVDGQHKALLAMSLAAANLCFKKGDHFWRITPEGKLIEDRLRHHPLQRDLVVENLRHSRQQLRRLSASLQDARESESQRIARQIHDNLGAALTALKMDIAWINKHIQDPRPVLEDKLRSMSGLIDQTVDSVRQIATELRPAILDEVGLIAALEWQLREFEDRTGIDCSFNCSVDKTDLDDSETTAIFRIFQEALTNIARHAQASQVRVTLEMSVIGLSLRVHDNGRGITPTEINHLASLGLLGMQERALMVGGRFSIEGNPLYGTQVTIQVPLHRPLGPV